MKKRQEHPISLKWGLLTAIIFCWVVPILIIVSVAGYLLSTNYEQHLRHSVESGTAHAMEEVQLRVNSALEASKAVSYDGDVRSAYRDYLETENKAQLYSSVTGYLSRSYSRDENFRAVFITFLDQPENDYSYVVAKGSNSYNLLQDYRTNARETALKAAANMDTGIRFLVIDRELYLVRNLMDSQFHPYAVLVMLCDSRVLFQSLDAITSLTDAQITLDETVFPLPIPDCGEAGPDDRTVRTELTTEVGGHTLTFRAQAREKNLWGAMPALRWAVALIVLLVLPLLAVIFIVFYRHVTHPVETLVNAANRVQAGERGCQIEELPHNQEFQKLTRHFNSMSTELKSQFDRLYLEQQALQQARIKALQSQINPHFLGNTLEIINWEARLAEDDKVSAMIEALSTMLDAAIGRDGRSQIALREELTYVDAYLYIIKQRLGDGLTIEKDIDGKLLEQTIPRLLLQPLVENAVDHDIAKRRGSALIIRVYAKDRLCYLEVEHEGSISSEDRSAIDRLLSTPGDGAARGGRVGICNLNQRLQLIYPGQGRLTIEEIRPGHILARVQLPLS